MNINDRVINTGYEGQSFPIGYTTRIAEELAERGWTVVRVNDSELRVDAPSPHPLSVFIEYPDHQPGVLGLLWLGGLRPVTRLRQAVAQANKGDFGPGQAPGAPGMVEIEEWPTTEVLFNPAVHPGWLADLVAAAIEPEEG